MTLAWRAPAAVLLALLSMPAGAFAQGRGGAQGPPPTGKATAPIDVTGHWVAEITEDWRWRMVTPAKGDYPSVPMTPAAVASADTWDPKKDEAAGEQCRAYGAPGLMRGPTRLHITWQDDNTLQVDTDYGQQTRQFHFGEWMSPGGAPTWQGESTARWVTPAGAPVGRGATTGSLEILTSHLRPGYLRKNGIPYSANTVFNETWDVITERNGDARLLMLLRVTDPMNLRFPWIVSVHFKKEPDGSKWSPSACSSTW